MEKVIKGIACRVCKNITKDGTCSVSMGGAVNRKEECWRYENKNTNSGLAEHSKVDSSWN